MRSVLRLLLELDGIEVTEAADGMEAFEQLTLLKQRDPHLPTLILLDWMMPRCSGDEFRRKQLSDPVTADVPILVISAADQGERAFRDLRPLGFVSKPFEPERLLEVVRSACLSLD